MAIPLGLKINIRRIIIWSSLITESQCSEGHRDLDTFQQFEVTPENLAKKEGRFLPQR